MRHCIFVIGTRAQMVKVAPVLRSAGLVGLTHTVWLSGQHSESIDDLIADFGIRSEFCRPQRSSERATIARLLAWLPGAVIDCYRYVHRTAAQRAERPLVIVHGDTLSTLVSAIAGKLAGGDIVHLESGLTSGRLLDPFPEEILRRVTFRLTRYAVCPNDSASRKMRDYRCKEIVDTGENTVLDCVRYALNHIDDHDVGTGDSYFVASIHRAQNIYLKSRLARIVEEILSVSAFGKVHFVLHPATRKRLISTGLWRNLSASPSIRLEPRMPYSAFLTLLAHARGVFSDGGSNQEELSYLGVPTVLFRDRTERPEGLGRNIVLRDSIDELTGFVRSGQIDLLRQPRRLQLDVKPSETAVDALYRWSTRP
jgi:UDP-N-acetylglucosamine 2-epimerase (non-hydrolysing)